MYYVLKYSDWDADEAPALRRPTSPNLEGVFFNRGCLIDPMPNEPIVFEKTQEERGKLGDYVVTGLVGPVISIRFREVLDAAGVDNVQYIGVEIHDIETGVVHNDYVAANIVGVVDCIDLERSRFSTRVARHDMIQFIDELHIDESKTPGLKIFRLARKKSIILVDATTKEAIESAGLRGVILRSAEGYSV